MSELLYQIGITKIPHVGAVTAKSLIGYCGGVKAVFEAKKKALQAIPGIGPETIKRILSQDVLGEAEEELKFIEKNEVQPIFYLDKNYPARLKHYHDCPILLFHKGNTNLNAERTVAIVGTRDATVQGKAICEELVEGLKEFNPLIVSGLAYGIDICAHRKSVEMDIPTLGVLGHGLSSIYPPAHRKTVNEMVENGGVMTEYTHNEKPDRQNFPMRNRIVAGLSDVVIVVESAVKGGSIITAKLANKYSKDVFAVPGRLRDSKSQGCNHLIKTHLAALIESVDDIAYVMRWEKTSTKEDKQQRLFVDLSDGEKTVIDVINELEEAGIDNLTQKTQIANSEMASLLLNLEFKGIVKSLPGKRYVLV